MFIPSPTVAGSHCHKLDPFPRLGFGIEKRHCTLYIPYLDLNTPYIPSYPSLGRWERLRLVFESRRSSVFCVTRSAFQRSSNNSLLSPHGETACQLCTSPSSSVVCSHQPSVPSGQSRLTSTRETEPLFWPRALQSGLMGRLARNLRTVWIVRSLFGGRLIARMD